MVSVTNHLTGEVYDFETDSPEALRDSWKQISETIKTLKIARDKLKPMVSELITERGTYEFDDCLFRQSSVQRMNYDKSVMREVLDADMFDELLIPDKSRIDDWLKENAEKLGEVSTVLRKNMIAVGQPYTTIRLERREPAKIVR